MPRSKHTTTIPRQDVKAIRKATGLSQREFGEKFGLDHESVKNWEAGILCSDAANSYLHLISKYPHLVATTIREAKETK